MANQLRQNHRIGHILTVTQRELPVAGSAIRTHSQPHWGSHRLSIYAVAGRCLNAPRAG
jgi:hypothetical protein